MIQFEEKMWRGGDAAIREAARFFMHDDPVHQTLREIARRLDALRIPYAIVGGMAFVAHSRRNSGMPVEQFARRWGVRVD